MPLSEEETPPISDRLAEFLKKVEIVDLKLTPAEDWSQEVYESTHQSFSSSKLIAAIECVQIQAVQATKDCIRQANQEDISGAVFDFVAWLIAREEPVTVGGKSAPLSERRVCTDIADLIAEWAKERDLSIENARIAHWRECLP